MNILKTIINSKYKWWLISLLVLTMVVALIYAIATPEKDLVEILLIGILVSLLINLLSSFVTIIFIDERDRQQAETLDITRQSVVVGKLIRAINAYNEFFANLYKATSVNTIVDLEERSKNILYETDVFVEHLNKLDFNKNGYMVYDVPPFEVRLRQIQQGDFKLTSYSWLDIFLNASLAYVEAVFSIQDNYLFCLNNPTLINLINGIANKRDLLKKGQGHNNFEMIRLTPNWLLPVEFGKSKLYPTGVAIKSEYSMLHTLDTLFFTKNLMAEIDKITQKENFIIRTSLFTADNVSPKIGSGIDEGLYTAKEAATNA